MSLKSLNNIYTDKDSIHTYLDTYEKLFNQKKYNKDLNILEVGVYTGGSIKLWRDYFENGRIYGVDVCDSNFIQEKSILNDERVFLYLQQNAYDINFINANLINKKFDFIIDDGPHSLESMIFFANYYIHLLKDDGVLIIEDVQDEKWLDYIKNSLKEEYKQYVNIVDVRNVKGRYDDLMFIRNKSNVQL